MCVHWTTTYPLTNTDRSWIILWYRIDNNRDSNDLSPTLDIPAIMSQPVVFKAIQLSTLQFCNWRRPAESKRLTYWLYCYVFARNWSPLYSAPQHEPLPNHVWKCLLTIINGRGLQQCSQIRQDWWIRGSYTNGIGACVSTHYLALRANVLGFQCNSGGSENDIQRLVLHSIWWHVSGPLHVLPSLTGQCFPMPMPSCVPSGHVPMSYIPIWPMYTFEQVSQGIQ